MYVGGFLAVMGIVLGVYLSIALYRPPSCLDAVQNQGELGVDCGGPCALLCPSQVQPMVVSWAQGFEVSPGWWSALAYVENPNVNAYAQSIPYRFRLFDKDGLLIIERRGTTFVGGNDSVVPIFVGRLNVSKTTPYRTMFEWEGEPEWVSTGNAYQLSLEEQRHMTREPGEEVTATLQNNGPDTLYGVEVVVIVYDDREHAIATSQTFVETLAPREKRRLTFVWPQRFKASVGRIELVPRVPWSVQR